MDKFMRSPCWNKQPADGLELTVPENLASTYERAFHVDPTYYPN
mgnify:CR=1 FL=1